MRLIVFFLVAGFVTVSLCGCETVKGIGRDIEGASSSVEHAMSPRNR